MPMQEFLMSGRAGAGVQGFAFAEKTRGNAGKRGK